MAKSINTEFLVQMPAFTKRRALTWHCTALPTIDDPDLRVHGQWRSVQRDTEDFVAQRGITVGPAQVR